MNLIALHGFLGHPSDWDGFHFSDLQSINLFSFHSWSHLWEWAGQLNQSVQGRLGRKILMGYSLGGRLALHALLLSPTLWQAAIIISAHPGLLHASDKEKRDQIDREWAHRFQSEEWATLMQAWDSRDIFKQSDYKFERRESAYQRQHLAYVLQQASLAHQDDLRQAIQGLPIPILWIVGERDQTYTELAKSIILSHPQSSISIVPCAGHRVPWEQPALFKQQVEQFIHFSV